MAIPRARSISACSSPAWARWPSCLAHGVTGMTLSDLKQTNQFHLGRPVLVMALIMCVAGIALFAAIATRAV